MKPSKLFLYILYSTPKIQKNMAEHSAEKPAGYLEGQLLVATPGIQDSCFAKSVVYIFAHDDDGAMGVVINHIFDNLKYEEILKQFNIVSASSHPILPVHFGGPIQSERGFVVHSRDYLRGVPLKLTGELALSSSVEILQDIAKGEGPRDSILALGYAGWEAGQLEKEIEANSWLPIPASHELIFGKHHKSKWQAAAESVGVDLNRFSLQSGHA